MALMKSISGIRGTIGGRPGNNLTPVDIVNFSAAYGEWIRNRSSSPKVVIGRDGRISGRHVNQIVTESLIAMGIDVIDIGHTSTPTLEMFVPEIAATGGIVLTASHNPAGWNALKLLNEKGEFLNAEEGKFIIERAEQGNFNFASIEDFGVHDCDGTALEFHIRKILELSEVNVELIKKKAFHIIVDCINSTGSITLPPLFKALGCTYELINGECNGRFNHTPEPLEKNLQDTLEHLRNADYDVAFVVDPDVDRLVIIDENAKMVNEEYTIVILADHVLSKTPGNTVSNLSSSRALKDVTEGRGSYAPAAVGEVNVVQKMKETNAVFGGEGNGGVIMPSLHYGRDALAGAAMMLSFMAESGKTVSEIRCGYNDYYMAKLKTNTPKELNISALFREIGQSTEYPIDTIDGLKINFEDSWVHMRSSNTEPIIRIYSEAPTMEKALEIAENYKRKLESHFS